MEDVYEKDKSEIDTFIGRLLTATQDKQFKLIVTSRIGVEPCELPGQEECFLRFDNRMIEFQLLPLKKKHARTLLRRVCKQLTDEKCDQVLEMCGHVPLAINLVSHTIRDYSAYEKIDELSKHEIGCLIKPVLNSMFDCIMYAYSRLDNGMKKYLHMLSIFETSEFPDVIDVAKVLNVPVQEALIILMSLSHRQLLQRRNIRRSRHYVDLTPLKQSITGFTYTFHPLICNFLNNETKRNEFQQDMQSSRIQLCKLILERFDHFPDFEQNYQLLVQFVQTNTVLMNTFFNVMSSVDTDMKRIHISPMHRLFMSRIAPLVMNTSRRRTFFLKVAERFKATNQMESYFSWKTESAICCVEDDDVKEAAKELSHIDEGILGLNTESSASIKAEYFLTKGRLLRRTQQYEKAIRCLRLSCELYESCQPRDLYLSRIAYVLNAIGNVHYDRKDLDKALEFHQQAEDIMKLLVKDGVNIDMSIYTFNLGTIHRAKGQQLYELNKAQAKEMFEKALVKFEESMSCDVRLNLTRNPRYADKLKQRCHMLILLKRFEEAVADAKQGLEIRKTAHETWHPKRTLAYYFVGHVYLRWLQTVQRKDEVNVELRNTVQKEAIAYFRDAEKEVVNNGLSNTDEGSNDFITDYKMLACLSRNSRFQKEVNQFCEEFAAGFSSSSSSSSSSSVSGESEIEEVTNRHDSGVADSVSSSEIYSASAMGGSSTVNIFLKGVVQKVPSLDDEVFMPADELSERGRNYENRLTKRRRSQSSSESD